MTQVTEILSTAEATATGGRTGRTRTSDGRLDLQLSRPKELNVEVDLTVKSG